MLGICYEFNRQPGEITRLVGYLYLLPPADGLYFLKAHYIPHYKPPERGFPRWQYGQVKRRRTIQICWSGCHGRNLPVCTSNCESS